MDGFYELKVFCFSWRNCNKATIDWIVQEFPKVISAAPKTINASHSTHPVSNMSTLPASRTKATLWKRPPI